MRNTHLNRITKNGGTRKSNENSMKLWNSLTTMASSAKTESRRRRTSSSHQNHLPLSRPHHNRRINHRRQPRYGLSSHHCSAISMAMHTVTSSTASMAPSTRRQAQRCQPLSPQSTLSRMHPHTGATRRSATLCSNDCSYKALMYNIQATVKT